MSVATPSSTSTTATGSPVVGTSPSHRGRVPIRYVVLETKRQLRNVRAIVFTIAVPVVMLLVFGAAYGSGGQVDTSTGLPWLVVTTLQMASYGAMMASLGQAFAIVNERALGWNRQLRVTPLSGSAFLASKTIAAITTAAVSIVVVMLVATVGMHASIGLGHWLGAGVGILLGVVPFTLIAILIGQFAKPSFAQPMFVVVFMGLAILGGLWVPLSIMPSWMGPVAHLLPSFWLNRIGQIGAGSDGSLLEPVTVMLAWTVVLGAVVVWRYRRDAARQ